MHERTRDDEPGAITDARTRLAAAPDDAAALRALATALRDHARAAHPVGRADAAWAAAAESVGLIRQRYEASPTDPVWREELAASLAQEGAVRGAALAAHACLDEATELWIALGTDACAEAERAEAYAKRAHLGAALAHYAQAERATRAGLELAPDHVPHLTNLAWVLRRAARAWSDAGRPDRARERRDEGLRAARRLLALEPGNTRHEPPLADDLEAAGDLARDAKDDARALALYGESLALRERILSRGDTPNRLHDVATLHTVCGDLHWDRDELDQAVDCYAQAEPLWQRRADVAPCRAEWRGDVAWHEGEFGDLLRKRDGAGDADRALQYYDRALARLRALLAEEPNRATRRDALVPNLYGIAMILQDRYDYDGAAARLDECVAIDRLLVAQEPDEWTWRKNLVIDLGRLGRLHDNRGALDRAQEPYEEAIALARADVDRVPATHRAAWEAALAGHLVSAGYLWLDRGDVARARVYFDEALALRRHALACAPTSARGNDRTAWALHALAEAHRAAGDAAAAVRSDDEALALLRTLLASAPSKARRRRRVAEQLVALGLSARAAGDGARARECHEEAVALARALGATDPGRTSDDVLAEALTELGATYLHCHEHDAARAALDEAETRLRALLEGHPRNVAQAFDLARVRMDQARLAEHAADARAAQRAWREAAAVLTALTREAPLWDAPARSLALAQGHVREPH